MQEAWLIADTENVKDLSSEVLKTTDQNSNGCNFHNGLKQYLK